MKYLLILMILIAVASKSNAQTSSGTQTGSETKTGQKKTQTSKQEKKRQQRGTGQYYGSKDTTPGSPMGTGGAGGDMSGSPAASAIETDDQKSKAQTHKDSSGGSADNMSDTTVKKTSIKRTGSVHHKSRKY